MSRKLLNLIKPVKKPKNIITSEESALLCLEFHLRLNNILYSCKTYTHVEKNKINKESLKS